MRRSEESRCPYCGADLGFDVKEEPSSWKVHATCADPDCSREYSAGQIPRSKVNHLDDVYELAEQLHAQL